MPDAPSACRDSNPPPDGERIAWFVSPHGFAHAARASAVITAMLARRPGLRFDLYTSLPSWFI